MRPIDPNSVISIVRVVGVSSKATERSCNIGWCTWNYTREALLVCVMGLVLMLMRVLVVGALGTTFLVIAGLITHPVSIVIQLIVIFLFILFEISFTKATATSLLTLPIIYIRISLSTLANIVPDIF